jgi:hypothetical protein
MNTAFPLLATVPKFISNINLLSSFARQNSQKRGALVYTVGTAVAAISLLFPQACSHRGHRILDSHSVLVVELEKVRLKRDLRTRVADVKKLLQRHITPADLEVRYEVKKKMASQTLELPERDPIYIC